MKNPLPPRWVRRLLHWYCSDEVLETLEGDVYELYQRRYAKHGKLIADMASLRDVISACRPFAFGKSAPLHANHFDMFRNYLKITTRSLSQQKLYAILNIGGLTLGLTCFITIMLYVQHEFSYNRFYAHSDNIYRVYQRQTGNAFLGTDVFAVTPAPLATAMAGEFPEVVHASTLAETTGLITHRDNHFYEKGLAGDASFFNVLQMPFVEGNPAKALIDPMSIVLTKSLAKTMFGNTSPVGEIVRYLGKDGYHVTAVVEDAPPASSLKYSFIVSMSYNNGYVEEMKRAGWNNNSYYTFFVLADGVNPASVERKFPALIRKNQLPEDYKNYPFKDVYYVERFADVYFHPDINFDIGLKGNRETVYLFAGVALIVLLLACVNYMNLAVARSIRRAREVGLRKVAGAVRRQLMGQFLAESTAITFLSLILAVGLVYLLVPYFGSLIERPVEVDFITNAWLLPGLLAVMLVVGLLSGSYPAMVMAALKPIEVLKVKGHVRVSGFSLQRALIIIQFTASTALVIGSLIIYRQLNFIKTKELGYNKENILTVRLRDFSIREKFVTLSNKWSQNPDIIQATLSSHLPTSVSSSTMMKSKPEAARNDVPIYQLSTAYNYLDLFGIELVAGRNFSRDFADTTESNFIFNETAVKALGWTPDEAVGKQFFQADAPPKNIIGVVKDFHMHSMREPIHPLMIRFSEKRGGYFSFKINPSKTKETIAYIERTIKEVSPYPFEYEFLDDNYDTLYASEMKLGEIFATFTCVSIVIASLGLFGLAAFMAGQRTKEIGIRKVLGASGQSIVLLVSKDFMKLVLIAFAVAIPISWCLMRNWLQEFAYRIDMEWWIFAIAGLLAFLIANISIGYQSVRAASMNPVESLRRE